MKWLKKYVKGSHPELPAVDEISVNIPAISEYFELFRLPDAFKKAESDTIPVINTSGALIGIVTEFDLAKVLPEWSFEDNSYRYNFQVSQIMTRDVWAEFENTNIEDILTRIHEMHTRVIPIITQDGKYTGKCITRSDLITYLTRRVKPQSIGGLATPLGVYMTDGRHQAGPGNAGFIATGIVFATMMFIIRIISSFIPGIYNMPEFYALMIQLGMFLLLLRITPLVKLHAAEHQTINAIEKGLPLTIEAVKMQPRPHKRCGTNLMVLVTGIMVVINLSEYIGNRFSPFNFLIITTGFFFVFSSWRSIGMWLQEYFTTAKAEDKYIMSGIKAGEEILKRHKADTDPSTPGFIEKLWNTGLIVILLSFISTTWIIERVLPLLRLIRFM